MRKFAPLVVGLILIAAAGALLNAYAVRMRSVMLLGSSLGPGIIEIQGAALLILCGSLFLVGAVLVAVSVRQKMKRR